VWSDWKVTYRDMFVVNREGHAVALYNLTDHDLGEAGDYQAALDLLIEVGER